MIGFVTPAASAIALTETASYPCSAISFSVTSSSCSARSARLTRAGFFAPVPVTGVAASAGTALLVRVRQQPDQRRHGARDPLRRVAARVLEHEPRHVLPRGDQQAGEDRGIDAADPPAAQRPVGERRDSPDQVPPV